MLSQGGFTFNQIAVVRGQSYRAEWVVVGSRCYEIAYSHIAVEFLANLSHECSRRCLVRFYLPAGEFPHPSQWAVGTALYAQHKAITHNDSSHDVDLVTHA